DELVKILGNKKVVEAVKMYFKIS
ncbi:MAG: hypothetical protein US24_C0010G0011, partial [candidate division WS6 bacterium GW2011_GWC2_36_7]